MISTDFIFSDSQHKIVSESSQTVLNEPLKGNILIKLQNVDYEHLSRQLYLNGVTETDLNALNLIQKSMEDSDCSVTIQSNNSSNLFKELCEDNEYDHKITWKDCIKYVFDIKKTLKGPDDRTKQLLPLNQILFGEEHNFKKSILIIDDHLCDKDCAIGWFFMKSLDLMGKEKGWRIFCVQTPNEFFEVFHEYAIDVVVIDHSYDRYKTNPEAFDPISLKYTAPGIENMQHTIIERLKKEHIEGWEYENIIIYEPLPFIIKLTNESIEPNEDKQDRTIYKYKLNDSDNLYCIKDDDAIVKSHTNSQINKWLELRCLLKGQIPSSEDKRFDYEYEGINISIDLSIRKGKINTSYLDIFKRIQSYIGISKRKGISSIKEDADWQPPTGESPYSVSFNNKNLNTIPIRFCGIDFYNPILLAATPLTGIQQHSHNEALKWYKDKLNMLFSSGVGGLILKTVYYDYEDFINDTEGEGQPTVREYSKVQKKSKTRVYGKLSNKTWYIGESLYNTGKTSTENLTFKEMIEFLRDLQIDKKDTQRIILSVGSKSYDQAPWESVLVQRKVDFHL